MHRSAAPLTTDLMAYDLYRRTLTVLFPIA